MFTNYLLLFNPFKKSGTSSEDSFFCEAGISSDFFFEDCEIFALFVCLGGGGGEEEEFIGLTLLLVTLDVPNPSLTFSFSLTFSIALEGAPDHDTAGATEVFFLDGADAGDCIVDRNLS